MLQIQDIRKTYITGELVQTALDGVSLNLRDNEFVAILGPSGSGKTTLLNVIGGLDRYDSGDLVINGISTKKYSDRDWDSYRNHTIGFVFQSYNLIPHQSVLANVELALTISGISRSERRRRAIRALEDVGLGNQLHKKPNQMSGGQMQRVAIARALVNDPDILLADEPTGALDSETSVQVMDLLQEVSRNRLVVMVTHNPELAQAYANRIVRVKDGRIIGDTNPYAVDASTLAAPQHKNMGKSSMSFLTALALSFNNLRTKKGRTLLTAFAGSIGIIGIALIMSLSTGFQKYIDKIQADTLSNYPLTIQSDTADMTSAFAAFGASMSAAREAEAGVVVEQPMVTQMFAQVGSNDLASFKAHLEDHYGEISHTISTIQYSYGIQPRIFSANTENGILQANPSTLFDQIMGGSPMASYMSSNVFYEMIDNRTFLETQYDVLQGRWPQSYNEMVIVLPAANQITDYMAYTLGLKDDAILHEMIRQVMSGQTASEATGASQWSYEDLLALDFRLVPVSGLYRYNAEYNVWEDMSGDTAYMETVIAESEPLYIVGIVCAREGAGATALAAGVAYTKDLTCHVIDLAAQSPIVQSQLADENINVFTGVGFDEETQAGLDFENMISVDSDAISSAFGMNISADSVTALLNDYLHDVMGSLNVDTSAAQADFTATLTSLGSQMLEQHLSQQGAQTVRIYLDQVEGMVDSYLATAQAQEQLRSLANAYGLSQDSLSVVYRPLLIGLVSGHICANVQVEGTDALLPQLQMPATAVAAAVTEETTPTQTPSMETQPTESVPTETQPAETPSTETQPTESVPAQTQPAETIPEESLPDTGDDTEQPRYYAELCSADISALVADYVHSPLVTGTAAVMGSKMMESTMQGILMSKLSEFGDLLTGFMGSAMYVDGEKIASAFRFNMTEEDLQRLMLAMSGQSTQTSAATNLQNLGYADLAQPTGISIYLTDFAAKEAFLAFLDGYNEAMSAAGKEEQVIRYTDLTGMMMSSVRTIIDSVSYALIAFVAVSLVVSSIMIGIITYISVMERTKEIGVLRAIGASKRNISQVFNAETFIIGLFSGMLGIGITLLILIPGNLLIQHLTNNPDIVAQLPVANAVILIGLSMVLTLIGGFIPAKQAAKKDPVIALRSE